MLWLKFFTFKRNAEKEPPLLMKERLGPTSEDSYGGQGWLGRHFFLLKSMKNEPNLFEPPLSPLL